mmetsp:Transcript_4972/g.16656  ORF Transcript_4972/g.16656 Transcript_4972/m.16656 type:complete len:370 (+) Transcript_4972:176-1285(+)
MYVIKPVGLADGTGCRELWGHGGPGRGTGCQLCRCAQGPRATATTPLSRMAFIAIADGGCRRRGVRMQGPRAATARASRALGLHGLPAELLVGAELLEGPRAEHGGHVLLLDHLLLEEQLGEFLGQVPLLREQLQRAVVGLLDQGAHLCVHELRRLLRVGALRGKVPGPRGRVGEGPDLVVHAVGGDQGVGQARDPLQVVLGPRGDAPKEDALGNAAAEHHAHGVQHLRLGGELLLLWHELGKPERGRPAGHDGHFEERGRVLEEPAHRGVARLVVRDRGALLLREDLALLLQAADHAVHGALEMLHGHAVSPRARRVERGLVAHVGDVRPGEPGSECRHGLGHLVRGLPELDLAQVVSEHVEAAPDVR